MLSASEETAINDVADLTENDSHVLTKTLKDIRKENLNRVIFAQLNINSIRNKFDVLSTEVHGNVDILLITETKIDQSFPTRQFLMAGYSEPYRLDRNQHGGGLLVYVREDIPSHILKTRSISIEALFIEINLRKKKWLICCLYNPHKSLISKHLNEIQVVLDIQSTRYENLLFIGDFNCEYTDCKMIDFCQNYALATLIKEYTCFKNILNPTCIDLMLTNKPKSFMKSTVIESDISDFHRMTLTVMKSFFPKQKHNIIRYRDYQNFSNENFRNDLLFEISNNASKCFKENFQILAEKTFNKHAPIKSKYLRANQAPFMNKSISKAIMNRSKLRKRYLKNQNVENKFFYNRQRNFCVSLIRKTKKAYFNSIETDNIVNGKKFWQTVKPFLSDKGNVSNKITLIENDDIITNDLDLANTFNDYFVNIVPSLGISENANLVCNNNYINDPLKYIIQKYQDHPSIVSINENKPNKPLFLFNTLEENTLKTLIDT